MSRVKIIIPILILSLLIILPIQFVQCKTMDKGQVYRKQVVITYNEGVENRVYELWLENPDNESEKGLCIVDSFTYQLYYLLDYYPYDLWGK